MDPFNIVCAVAPFLLLGSFVMIGLGLMRAYNNQEKWCEKCNTWQVMSRRSGQIEGWDCPNCSWTNQNKLGTCPKCGWYGRYINKTISRRGPFRKVDRTSVTPFWGVQEEYWAYEDQIHCPKHGIFTAHVPVDADIISEHDE